MDISFEMIHALLHLHVATVLASLVLAVGLIEGLVEGTASITKVFSRALSDRLGKRKLLALFGYGLGALQTDFSSRFGPRLAGRSTLCGPSREWYRGAPRDALVPDVAPAHCAEPPLGCGKRWIASTHSSERCRPLRLCR